MKQNENIAIPDEQAMRAFATKLARAIPSGAVIYLEGDLGAGKTTLARGFLRALGFQEKVKSPTFTLVEPYEIDGRWVFHFDLYRIHAPAELNEIGIAEYFQEAAICLIEWPAKGYPLLPAPDLTCYILMAGNGREIRLHASTDKGEQILARC